jgi:hypothetical protein
MSRSLILFIFLVKPVSVRIKFVAIPIRPPCIRAEALVARRRIFVLWIFIPIKVFVCRVARVYSMLRGTLGIVEYSPFESSSASSPSSVSLPGSFSSSSNSSRPSLIKADFSVSCCRSDAGQESHSQCANCLATHTRMLFVQVPHTDDRVAIVQIIYVVTFIVLGGNTVPRRGTGQGWSTS